MTSFGNCWSEKKKKQPIFIHPILLSLLSVQGMPSTKLYQITFLTFAHTTYFLLIPEGTLSRTEHLLEMAEHNLRATDKGIFNSEQLSFSEVINTVGVVIHY